MIKTQFMIHQNDEKVTLDTLTSDCNFRISLGDSRSSKNFKRSLFQIGFPFAHFVLKLLTHHSLLLAG